MIERLIACACNDCMRAFGRFQQLSAVFGNAPIKASWCRMEGGHVHYTLDLPEHEIATAAFDRMPASLLRLKDPSYSVSINSYYVGLPPLHVRLELQVRVRIRPEVQLTRRLEFVFGAALREALALVANRILLPARPITWRNFRVKLLQ